MNVSDIDSFAKNSIEPAGLDILEVGLWHKLNALYRQFDANKITIGEARKAKIEAFEEFEHEAQIRRIYMEQNRRAVEIGKIMAEVNKNGCEVCRRVAKIYDGRIKQ